MTTFDQWVKKADDHYDWENLTPTEMMRIAWSAARHTTSDIYCGECGGNHEPSGARSDCIRHWRNRALQAENAVLLWAIYRGEMASELRAWLDQQIITSENIGEIRRSLMMPWATGWNALVRSETAERENKKKQDDDND